MYERDPYNDPSSDEWHFSRLRARHQEELRNNPIPEIVKDVVEEGPDFLHQAFADSKEALAAELELRFKSIEDIRGSFWVYCPNEECQLISTIGDMRKSLRSLRIEEEWIETNDGYDIANIKATAQVCCTRCESPTKHEDEQATSTAFVNVARNLESSGYFEYPDIPGSYQDGHRNDDSRWWVPVNGGARTAIEALVMLVNSAPTEEITVIRRLIEPVEDNLVEILENESDKHAKLDISAMSEQLNASRIVKSSRPFTPLDIGYLCVDLYGTSTPTEIGYLTFTQSELDQPHDSMFEAHAADPYRFTDPSRILTADEIMGELDELRTDMGFPPIV